MANFCIHCGRPLKEGESCNCKGKQTTNQTEQSYNTSKTYCTNCGRQISVGATCDCGHVANATSGVAVVHNLVDKVNGEISSNEMFNGTWYERGQEIVPDNVHSNDGEVTIKQYKAAVLRSRVKFMRSEGRMQVTNKRLLFRATGRSLRGKTVLQHEFAIDEIAGVEIKKDYRFSILDLIGMLLLGSLVSTVLNFILAKLWGNAWVLSSLISLGLAFFAVCMAAYKPKKLFLNTLLFESGSAAMIFLGAVTRIAKYGSGVHEFFGGLFIFIGILFAIAVLVYLYLFCFKPNLSIDIKTKGGTAPVSIKRTKKGIFGIPLPGNGDDTGYNEVLPAEDTDLLIKEIGAMISDIQKLGDFGIKKWKK